VQALMANKGAIACPVTAIEEQLLDTLMLGLRLTEGVSVTKLVQQFGETKVQQILQCLDPYQSKGWVKWISKTPTHSSQDELRIQLTDPEGFLFSNVVLTQLFEELS
jgi:oxygen-independent coproporphyrinogen-3 oxidase